MVLFFLKNVNCRWQDFEAPSARGALLMPLQFLSALQTFHDQSPAATVLQSYQTLNLSC